jgi:hypothetical protein
MGHVWTAPGWQEESSRRRLGRVQVMCPASHDGFSVKGREGQQNVIQGGALIPAGFPAKPHIRWELIPTTVPHSGRESSKRTAPLCVDGAVAPRRTTATFPRITGCSSLAAQADGD